MKICENLAKNLLWIQTEQWINKVEQLIERNIRNKIKIAVTTPKKVDGDAHLNNSMMIKEKLESTAEKPSTHKIRKIYSGSRSKDTDEGRPVFKIIKIYQNQISETFKSRSQDRRSKKLGAQSLTFWSIL